MIEQKNLELIKEINDEIFDKAVEQGFDPTLSSSTPTHEAEEIMRKNDEIYTRVKAEYIQHKNSEKKVAELIAANNNGADVYLGKNN